ncbi:MAG: aminotransferase class V-fold PLP-dependent enzyme [Deltaproteobacteria bacterium]|nr:aminotransferase class V-fold PLP-dependent enzyme [Deltaproteobacteria bacterium]
MPPVPTPDLAAHWTLDPAVTFLNHGSYGACPRAVQQARSAWLARLEREPVTLLTRELEGLLAEVRGALGTFLGCRADDLALVSNATEGVGTVVRSLTWRHDDEVLVIDHGYNACKNAAQVEVERFGGRLVTAAVPFPLADAATAVEAILKSCSARTKLAIIDHIASPTAVLFPIKEIVQRLQARGIDVLVDGAHAPGMLPLDLDDLGAAYYTGNCHKWLCAPKGAAFLHVRRDRQTPIRPLVISHGANSPRTDTSRFRVEFDWTGTRDPSPWLTIPAAIEGMAALLPGGWPAIYQRNHQLAVEAREILCQALGVAAPCPPAMVGSMAAVILPAGQQPQGGAGDSDALHAWLWQRGFDLPIMTWNGQRILRVSCQLYNDRAQYQRLAELLQQQRQS